MVREIIVGEVSYRVKAAGWFLAWHWAHNNFAYHTDAEPNNKFIIPLSYQNVIFE